MKKVIDGRIFDTAKATRVAFHNNGRSDSDFRTEIEGLYRTSRGTWFLAGEGGALTKYRQQFGDMWGYGEAIIPLTDQEALKWLEDHEGTSLAEKYFEDVLEEA